MICTQLIFWLSTYWIFLKIKERSAKDYKVNYFLGFLIECVAYWWLRWTHYLQIAATACKYAVKMHKSTPWELKTVSFRLVVSNTGFELQTHLVTNAIGPLWSRLCVCSVAQYNEVVVISNGLWQPACRTDGWASWCHLRERRSHFQICISVQVSRKRADPGGERRRRCLCINCPLEQKLLLQTFANYHLWWRKWILRLDLITP